MTAPNTAKAPAKRSGVKSESSGEAAQIRKLAQLNAGLSEQVDRLERAVVALSHNNLAVAQDVMDSHL